MAPSHSEQPPFLPHTALSKELSHSRIRSKDPPHTYTEKREKYTGIEARASARLSKADESLTRCTPSKRYSRVATLTPGSRCGPPGAPVAPWSC